MKCLLYVLTIVLIAVSIVVSQPAPREQVGPLPDGGFLLNNGWQLQPAGKQIPLDTFPMSSALSPDGKYLLVVNGGYNPPSISVLDVAGQRELTRFPLPDAWLGIAFSKNGKNVYVGGGSQAKVYELAFSDTGTLSLSREFALVPEQERKPTDFTGDVAMTPDGRLIYAAELYRNDIAIVNPQSGMVIDRFKTGRRPYRILFHPDGKSFFVSSWADGTLYHYNSQNGTQLGLVRLGAHPTDIVWSDRKPEPEAGEEEPKWAARIFVAAANTNTVYSVAVSPVKDVQVDEVINVAMTPRQPLGMTPSALALSPDQLRLYTVCSDANAVAVADLTHVRSRVVGFVPTGWYPTAARVAGNQLFVLNGRGLRSYPNPQGPSPLRRPEPVHLGLPGYEYVGRLQKGTASVIEPFDADKLEEYTKTAVACSPYRDRVLDDVAIPDGNPVPRRPGLPSPIQHIVYIVKENRTYDQVFGDLGIGNGDPALVVFGADSTPNQRKLAREFVLLDNFYVNSDVSADGHNWATAAIAPDYTQKLWQNSYASRRKTYDYEGGEPANAPPAGYLWTQAIEAGLSMRNFGFQCVVKRPIPPAGSDQVEHVRDSMLARVTDMRYRGFDLDYPDIDRAATFITALGEFEKAGQMPRLVMMRLGNDHTSGTAAGKIAPLSSMADNDYALGQIVEAVSKTRFWPQTAIFVVEDDAQNGADHVDSHRSPAFVLSPYTHRGAVDSTMYNHTSVLRTMELILGLRPMTQFDAAARPMWAAFASAPDAHPYSAEKPKTSLTERNAAANPTAARSARLDFSDADRIDDDELNDILWRAIRKTEPPAPVRSYFAR
jgi:DNA-binding beta-propeller fold protein YncE